VQDWYAYRSDQGVLNHWFFDLGIDRILFRERLFDNVTGQHNQMAPNTALNFLLLGIALLLLNVRGKKEKVFFPFTIFSLGGTFVLIPGDYRLYLWH
jgi:hypothetical protein